ncbi:BgTH12-05398 [Blumeria graminis f. sp. triticale]|uniref:non-specific serine/threonine protein kinase n=1 Tax=Blumeria graminis f. sp. triticale TaxID=1689686 RepID=A0A9W4GFH7_BLUGR|nr:BgTH12-05398 [Blumeria graminis f. sp. triticale]
MTPFIMSISPEVSEYITQNPLGSILSTFCDASKSHQQPTSSSISGKQIDENISRSAIQNLIQDITSHNVTKKLGSQNEYISSQLNLICINLNHGLELSIFEPLTTAIFGKSSDLIVWKAILQLVNDYADLPITLPRKFVQESNQSWEEYVAPLRQEFRYSSYENVGGFWEKYFEGRPWQEQCSLTYLNLSKTHNRDALGNFPHVITEKDTWQWLNSFQNRLLDRSLESSDLSPIGGPTPSQVSNAYASRGKYYRLKKIEDTNASRDNKRIDLFIKSQKQSSELPSSWNDVLVLGHMTDYFEDAYSRNNFYHLAISVREVFWAQPLRRFIHGFVLSHTKLQLWVFDRSGAIGSDIIEIWEEPERFIYALTAYTIMSDDELGLDSFVQRNSCKTSIIVNDDLTQQEREFEIDDKPFQVDNSVVSHGTTYHQTKDGEYVVKFSWRAAEQRSEAEYLKAAKSIDGVTKLVGSRDIVSIKEIRSGLVFSPEMALQFPYPMNWCISGEIESHRNDANGPKTTKHLLIFEDQILTCVVSSPVGRPLSDFKTVNEFLTGMRDAIKAHWALFRDARILHRDISARNIILTDPNIFNGYSGMLSDLDNAIALEDDEKNIQGDSGVVIGTTVYLAIGILEAGSNPDTHGIEHTYRHDLESFFYVFLSICMCYGWNEKDKANIYFLSLWRPLDVESIFGDKCGRLSPRNFERTILDGFSPKFKNLKELAKKLRTTLFSDGILTKATPDDPEIMYAPILCAFDEALQTIP